MENIKITEKEYKLLHKRGSNLYNIYSKFATPIGGALLPSVREVIEDSLGLTEAQIKAVKIYRRIIEQVKYNAKYIIQLAEAGKLDRYLIDILVPDGSYLASRRKCGVGYSTKSYIGRILFLAKFFSKEGRGCRLPEWGFYNEIIKNAIEKKEEK